MPSSADTVAPARSPATLAVLGDVTEDIVVWLDEPIRHGSDTANQLFRRRGGSAANVAAFAGPLVPTRFFGCVGEDAAGDWLIEELRTRSIDVRVQRRGTTGTIVILIDEAGERTMFPNRAASRLIEPLEEAWLDGIGHLHAPAYGFEGGSTPASLVDALQRVSARGGGISLDTSSIGFLESYGRDRFLALVEAIRPNYLFANHDEAIALGFADGRPQGIAAETTLVLKNGAGPTVIIEGDGSMTSIPVPPVTTLRDATGAGDAFAAGFLAAVLRGHAVSDAAAAGNRHAAKVLAHPGASIG